MNLIDYIILAYMVIIVVILTAVLAFLYVVLERGDTRPLYWIETKLKRLQK